jgi:sugar lactone lactonase YvrE
MKWKNLKCKPFIACGALMAILAAACGKGQTAPETGARLTFTLPRASFVTLVIDDAKRQRVRNLVAEKKYEAGEHSIEWDGLDDTGKPVAAGQYSWRGLYRDPLKLEYQFSVYDANARPPWFTSPPWIASDSGWLSDHNPPRSVAALGNKVFVGTIVCEAGHDVMALDVDTGRKLWGRARPNGHVGASVLCSDGQWIYGAGEGQWGGDNSYVFRINPENYQTQDLWHFPRRLGLRGIAARGGKVYVSSDIENKIFVLDAKPTAAPQEVKPLREISLNLPSGLAFTPRGQLLVATPRTVLAVHDDGSTSPLITNHLTRANQLAVGADGTIYVTDGPPNWDVIEGPENRALYGPFEFACVGDNQIKVFDAEGKFLRAIGTPGGRKPGPYDPQAMRCPVGISIDKYNRLWVAEWDMLPKRISVWNAQSGKLEKEFIGAQKYGGAGALDPGDKTVMIYDGMLFKLDWQKGTWKLTDTIVDIMNAHVDAKHVYGGYAYWPTRIVRYKGEPYFVGGTSGHSEMGGTIWKRKGNTFQAVTYVGQFNPGLDTQANRYLYRGGKNTMHYLYARMVEQVGDKPPGYETRENRDAPYEWMGHLYYMMLWADQNGDGAVQPQEVTFTNKPHPWLEPTLVGPGLALYLRKAAHRNKLDLWRLPLSKINAQGAPIYDIAKLETLAKDETDLAGGSVDGMAADGAGRFYTMSSPLHGFDPISKTTWTYPNSWPYLGNGAPRAAPGLIVGGWGVRGACNLGGELGGLVAFNSNFGQWYLFTGDGLFVSTLFGDTRTSPYWGTDVKEARRGMDMQGISLGQESFYGWFGRTSDGQVYIVAGHPHCSIIKVAGLDSIKRLAGGRLQLNTVASANSTSPQAVRKQLAIRPFSGGKYLSNEPLPIKAGDAEVAHVRLAYDGDNLTANFKVTDASPLQNAGTDSKLLFKTGDSVDLQIGLDPNADPRRNVPVAGDIRLLLTKTQDGAIGVLYRYKVAGAASPERFWSPTGEVLVDKITVLQSPKDLKIDTSADKDGYTLTATIPWKTLAGAEYSPPVNGALRGDVGVLFSDPSGATTVERIYAFNQNTGIVADVPSEIRLHPERWGEWKFVVQ